MPNRRFKRIWTLWIIASRPPKSGWAVIMIGEQISICRILEDKIDKIWVLCPNPSKYNVRIFTQLLSLRHNSNVITWTVRWSPTSFLLRRQDQTSLEHVNIRILWVAAPTITQFKLEMILWTVRIEITVGSTTLVPKVFLRFFHSKIWITRLISQNLIPVEWPPIRILIVLRSVTQRSPQRDLWISSWITIISQWPPQFHQKLAMPGALLSKPWKIATLWDIKIWAYSL